MGRNGLVACVKNHRPPLLPVWIEWWRRVWMYSSLVTEGRKRGHLKPELFTDFWVGRQKLSLFLSFFNEPQVVEQKEPTCLAMKSARSSKLIRDRHLLLPFPLLVSSSLLPSLKYLFFFKIWHRILHWRFVLLVGKCRGQEIDYLHY